MLTRKIKKLEKNGSNLSNHKHCIAIGECGLDKRKKETLPLQIELFLFQATLAQQLKKPLIIHNVGYGYTLLELLKQIKFSQKFIFHGYNQSTDLAVKIIKANGYFSFGKAIFKENSNAQQMLKTLPCTHIFLETDDSDCKIEDIYQKAAEILNISLEDLQENSLKNFNTLLNIS